MTIPAVDRGLRPDTPVQYCKGVGEARATLLRAAGVSTVGHLLTFFPIRYEDRRHIERVADLHRIHEPVTLKGRIVSAGLKTSPLKRVRIFEAILDDGSGTVMLVWFNQPYLAEQIRKGCQIVVYGQPRVNNRQRLQLESPDFELVGPEGEGEEEGTIVPIYSRISGISPRVIRTIVQGALERVGTVEDPLPVEIRRKLGVMDLHTSMIRLHHPLELDEPFLRRQSESHRRMILQEFLAFQLALRVRRAEEERGEKKTAIVVDDGIRSDVRRVLPFALTGAQKRVLKEIVDDMSSRQPMYRLLQGDVGSGKTIVALIAAMVAIRNGHQAALLAPTEILAEQHFQRISAQLQDSGMRVEKLTATVKGSERRVLLSAIEAGDVDLLIGTHAILEAPVRFRSLALAIIDEQHRFGVEQRQRLIEKGDSPDVLVMTATPIPRSLAIAMFGDLELSVIDELPPGRGTVRTVVRGTGQLSKILSFLAEEIRDGAQAYVVFPVIDESEKFEAKALTTWVETIEGALPGIRLEVLHGRMTSDEKRSIMARFREREIDVLVSTTIIEVGLDVPNASVMLVMDSDRFGLSQLHQLRGRVGRGGRRSWCVLLRDERAPEQIKKRLSAFASTTDGFQVAEQDLQQRGAGDFFGTRQSGVPRFQFGDLLADYTLMERAREVAIDIVRQYGLVEARELASKLAPPEWQEAGSRD